MPVARMGSVLSQAQRFLGRAAHEALASCKTLASRHRVAKLSVRGTSRGAEPCRANIGH